MHQDKKTNPINQRVDELPVPASLLEAAEGRPAAGVTDRKRFRLIGIGAAALTVIVVALVLARMVASPDSSHHNPGTFVVQRGDLLISVTESGSVKAVNTVDLSCEVEGSTTIISIVNEGTLITPEDVNKMVLVELDSSSIKESLTRQQMDFSAAEASLTEATESLDIQKNQNDSDIQAGEMKVRFALMDLRKYLGEKIADTLMTSIENPPTAEGAAFNISALVEAPELGGEALQKLRELQGNIDLREQELKQAVSTLEWTQRLYDKNYVSLNDLEADKLKNRRTQISLDQAKTAKELFIKYEFPKEVERLFSDYRETQRDLQRIQARTRSRLAQAEAQLESKRATYSLQKERLEKLQRQLKGCIIKAPRPGQVVYSSSSDERSRFRSDRMIEIGAQVRERQKIISIPDASEMKVEMKVHEVWIDKVQPGQPAKITVAAFPDMAFTGKVLRKAPLADLPNFMSPDLKVYSTDVSIDGAHDFLKTGMTAKVEIIVDELRNITSVPIQAVVSREGKKFCFVKTANGTEQRQVETGAFNDNFVEVKQGLSEGEEVLLSPPRLTETAPGNRPGPQDRPMLGPEDRPTSKPQDSSKLGPEDRPASGPEDRSNVGPEGRSNVGPEERPRYRPGDRPRTRPPRSGPEDSPSSQPSQQG